MNLFLTAAPALQEVEDTLQNILSSPEFIGEEGFVSRIWRAIREFFWKIGNYIGRTDSLSRLVTFLGGAALIAVIILAIAIPLRNVRRGARVSGEEGITGKIGSRENAMELSQSAERRGDFTWALIYLFIAYLYDLQAKGHISIADGKTNRQYGYELRSAGNSELARFSDFSRTYAETRFGGLEPGADAFREWKARFSFLYQREARA